MKKIFLDTDIVYDLLAKREPHFEAAAAIFSMIERNECTAYISSLSFSHLHYFLRKLRGRNESIVILQKLKVLVRILAVDEKVIDLSLLSDFSDFEDAIQYNAALIEEVDYIVTRNIRDYRKSKIDAVTPDEFISIWKSMGQLKKQPGSVAPKQKK